ncbi:MAG: oligopeptide transporter, OPT family [Acidobacteria bacterium]|nr:oligopeptide transporter, OPT family [Acidobacteriota bacterium]
MATEKSDLEKSVAFKPYISAKEVIAEMTPRALLLGAIFGVIFGASSVYLALKVGLTVSASVPIAVLSITVLRLFGRATILENNIVQTTGSAGESIAAGVVFTLPALLILGLDLDVTRTTLIALGGGCLGVLLMIPLRRSLIVKEHGNLAYPEGTACAEVLIVGEKGGTDAKTVFMGFGIAFFYKVLMVGAKLWNEVPTKILTWYQNTRVAAEISPELLGVGYIIGPSVASHMIAGGMLAALIAIPMIKFFGAGWTTPLFPESAKLIADMSAGEIQDRYVRYIAAGAVATGGLVSLIKALPTIVNALKASVNDFRGIKDDASRERTMQDMPIVYVGIGITVLLVALLILPQLEVDIISALLILVFGFLFVTVSSRITGQIGASSNPISGMTIATLLLTSLIFLLLGRAGAEQRIVALTVGAIVCVAAANAGATSQDLKTGFLVGATPRNQQLGLLVGATTSALAIGLTLTFFNDSAVNLLPVNYPNFNIPAEQKLGDVWNGSVKPEDGKNYKVLNLPVEYDNGQGGKVSPGKYLVGDDNKLHYFVNPGVGGDVQQLVKPNAELASNTFLEGSDPSIKKIGTSRGLDDNLYTLVSVTQANNPTEPIRLLVDETGKPVYEINSKITKYPAPKAALMGILVDGVLTQRLPWSLILIGVFISLTLEMMGVAALPVAVGMYLPFSTSATIFAGGGVRALVERMRRKGGGQEHQSIVEEETGKGVLFSSGLIAGGAIAGLAYASMAVLKVDSAIAIGPQILGHLAENNIIALIIFAGLAGLLYVVAKDSGSSQKTK